MIAEYEVNLDTELEIHPVLVNTYHYLLREFPVGYTLDYIRVCHGDISSENMLLSDEGELFIVDWDTAVLTDYLYDIGQLFARYINKEDWAKWADKNQMNFTKNEIKRVKWYAYINMLLDIKYAYDKKRYNKMNDLILKLNHWLEDEGLIE